MSSRRTVPPLEREAGELFDAATAFIRIYQFRDRNHALKSGLTVVQAFALDLLLARGGHSLTDLARAIRLDKSTTSRVVSGMTTRGLVEWTRPEHDRRGKTIVASVEGRRRYRRLRRAVVRNNARLLATYPRAARRAAIQLLWQLAERATLAQAVATRPRKTGRARRSASRGA